MSKPKFLTRNFIASAMRFGVYYLSVMLTFLLGRLCAPLFDWVAYGQLRGLFVEIFTAVWWGIELIVLTLVKKQLRKKGILPPLPPKKTEDGQPTKPPVPLKNVWILTAITAACILLVSAVIGFEVKPFYDLGNFEGGYELWCAVGVIGRNLFKCIWIAYMLKACKNMTTELVNAYLPAANTFTRMAITYGLLMIFGLLDIFLYIVSYPMTWLSWVMALVYAIFYMAFVAVYHFTEEHMGKTCFLIALIYLF